MGLFLSYKKALVLSFLSEDMFSQLSFLLDKVGGGGLKKEKRDWQQTQHIWQVKF